MKVAIIGLGTIGKSTFEILTKEKSRFKDYGSDVSISYVCDIQSPSFELGDGVRYTKDYNDIINSDVSIVVEAIGGTTIAYEIAKATINAGKSFVTANKALIATHGLELSRLAEEKNVSLLFEAAVGGGIPLINNLKERTRISQATKILGIVNGTCNYILTEMEVGGKSFEEALKQAKELGYAEQDHSFDTQGIDASHKAVIMASICFGIAPDLSNIKVEGIEEITINDLLIAKEFGYKIKHLAILERKEDVVSQRVQPVLISDKSPLSAISSNINGALVEAPYIGQYLMAGPGAGGHETATAIVNDILGISSSTTIKTSMLGTAPAKFNNNQETASYLIYLEDSDQNVAEKYLNDKGIENDFLTQVEGSFVFIVKNIKIDDLKVAKAIEIL